MQEGTELISLRIPKSMGKDMGYAVKSGRYASRTELVREALREKLYKGLDEMRGALKGKVKLKGTHAQWRRAQWQNALKKAKGNSYKASEIMKKDEQGAIKGLRF